MARPIFKHQSEAEIVVAKAFIERVFPQAKVEFDVPLKSSKPADWESMPENYRKMWEYLTAKKIDMVMHLPEKILIVEVKQKLGASGVGQLLLYKMMYLEQYKPGKPVELWQIAMYPDPDVVKLCEKLGIKWWCLNASLI